MFLFLQTKMIAAKDFMGSHETEMRATKRIGAVEVEREDAWMDSIIGVAVGFLELGNDSMA